MKKTLRVVEGLLLAALSFMPTVLPAIAFAQNDEDKSVKQDVKDAGHSTKEAAKKTGSNIKKGRKQLSDENSGYRRQSRGENETVSALPELPQGGDSHEAKHQGQSKRQVPRSER